MVTILGSVTALFVIAANENGVVFILLKSTNAIWDTTGNQVLSLWLFAPVTQKHKTNSRADAWGVYLARIRWGGKNRDRVWKVSL
jgi:hypothetical protein